MAFCCCSRCSSCSALAGPAGRSKAVGVGPLLSMPGFLSAKVSLVGHSCITPETATEQSILEISSRTRRSQQQQHVLTYKPTRARTQMYRDAVQQRRRSSAAAGAVPVSFPPGQPARSNAVGVGPILSMPGVFFSAKVKHSRRHNIRDSDGSKHS